MGRGTLALRIRKMGYAAYFNSIRILAERADTIRMPRLAQSLAAVVVKEESGYGSDEMAYKELDQRMRWKSPTAGMISREELAQQGNLNLCEALPLTASGSQRVPILKYECPRTMYRVLLNGTECGLRKLTDFPADLVETIEYYPSRASDSYTSGGGGVGDILPKASRSRHGDNTRWHRCGGHFGVAQLPSRGLRNLDAARRAARAANARGRGAGNDFGCGYMSEPLHCVVADRRSS